MNGHRTFKLGCERRIEHSRSTCPGGFNFKVQIIIKLKGNGNNKDQNQKEERLKFEDGAIKALRTIYPYGLNERAKDKITGTDKHKNIGSLFPPLPRKSPPIRRERKNRNNRDENLTTEYFFC